MLISLSCPGTPDIKSWVPPHPTNVPQCSGSRLPKILLQKRGIHIKLSTSDNLSSVRRCLNPGAPEVFQLVGMDLGKSSNVFCIRFMPKLIHLRMPHVKIRYMSYRHSRLPRVDIGVLLYFSIVPNIFPNRNPGPLTRWEVFLLQLISISAKRSVAGCSLQSGVVCRPLWTAHRI